MAAVKGKGLGRGLDSLIPQDFNSSLLLDADERVQNLFVSQIIPNPDQPRRHFDQDALDELANSIKQHGVLQPLIVSPKSENEYKIIAGERRWRASKLAGIDKLPAIVRKEKELAELEIALIENVQRVDLSPLEQAVSIEKLHQQFNMSYNDIAVRLGKAVTTISNIVRLLQLPDLARKALQEGKISEGHARAILALKNDTVKQQTLLDEIIKRGWSVRQAEQFVQNHKRGAANKYQVIKQMAVETTETKQLSQKLGVPVSIRHTAKGGRLELHFTSSEELKLILDRLSKD